MINVGFTRENPWGKGHKGELEGFGQYVELLTELGRSGKEVKNMHLRH